MFIAKFGNYGCQVSHATNAMVELFEANCKALPRTERLQKRAAGNHAMAVRPIALKVDRDSPVARSRPQRHALSYASYQASRIEVDVIGRYLDQSRPEVPDLGLASDRAGEGCQTILTRAKNRHSGDSSSCLRNNVSIGIPQLLTRNLSSHQQRPQDGN